MSRAMFVPSLVLVVSGAFLSATAADTVYRAHRQPFFSILVPDGWTIEETERGVDLHHGKATNVVLGVQAPKDPSEALEIVQSQLQQQSKSFRIIDSGRCIFGNRQGVYMVYSVTSPEGNPLTTKLVIMATDQFSWLMAEWATADNYEAEKADFRRIQNSFTLEKSK